MHIPGPLRVLLLVLFASACGRARKTRTTARSRRWRWERGGLRPLFSDYDLFGAFTAGSFVVHRDFLQKNPRSARRLVEGIARAIEWSRAQPREVVVARMQALIKKRGRNEDGSFVQHWKSTAIAGKGGALAPREFQIWLDWLIEDGQIKAGPLPLWRFYSNELNPFQPPHS